MNNPGRRPGRVIKLLIFNMLYPKQQTEMSLNPLGKYHKKPTFAYISLQKPTFRPEFSIIPWPGLAFFRYLVEIGGAVRFRPPQPPDVHRMTTRCPPHVHPVPPFAHRMPTNVHRCPPMSTVEKPGPIRPRGGGQKFFSVFSGRSALRPKAFGRRAVVKIALSGIFHNAGMGGADAPRQGGGGGKVALVLLSAPDGMDYYRKAGLEKFDNCFSIRRR